MDYIRANDGSGKLACVSATKNLDVFTYFKDNRKEINSILNEFGGILLRGFSLRSISEFNKLANLASTNLLDYVNRSTPRTKLGGKIYTATEYPPHKQILFHNENSYTREWPDILLFFCVIAPKVGGETPLADSRIVFNKIDKEVIKKFNAKQVLYKRNFINGIDLSWQEVFQTSDKTEFHNYCLEKGIHYTWHDAIQNNIVLTTEQVCQATIKHPITKQDIWFNQAHLFHFSTLEVTDKNVLYSSLKREEYFPRNSYYGDGTEISEKDIQHIIKVYESEKIIFHWQKGDVLLLDNRIIAHARNSFSGDRKIVVAMGEL